MKRSSTMEERFWARVIKHGDDECWEWTGATSSGYGVLKQAGTNRKVFAHRLSLQIAGANIEGLHVCHRCDNPPCTNPAHLFVGTHKENMNDSARKNRKGQRLTPHLVREIRRIQQLGIPRIELVPKISAALGHAVSYDTICDVVARRTWKHL